MNIKLIAGLAVAISLASAMTFVSLASSSKNAPAGGASTSTKQLQGTTGAAQTPLPNATSKSNQVDATVKVGGDVVEAVVEIVP